MGRPKKIKYEDKIDIINGEIRKRRGKWFLDSIPWISFEDVEQIIRIHIYQKWSQWDQKRELKPWINKIITNQFKNILRNYYLNFAKPCSSCPFDSSAAGENFCSFTKSGLQDITCPLYAKWSKSKKSAHDVKIPLRLYFFVLCSFIFYIFFRKVLPYSSTLLRPSVYCSILKSSSS